MKYLPLFLLPLLAFGAPPKTVDVDDYIQGKVILGKAYTDMALKNKPMIICMWRGAQVWRPESTFQRLAKALEGTEGKIVPVAVEVSGMAPAVSRKYTEEMVNLLKSLDVKYTVVMGTRKTMEQQPQIIPFCYILDAKKTLIYSGMLGGNAEFDHALKSAIASGEAALAKDAPKDPKK